MKTKETIHFASSSGKDTVRGYMYAPGTAPRAVVQLSHGMCEYVERYEPFLEFLTAHGFAVCGNDHLGHGHTAKNEKELGVFPPRDGRKCLVEDLYAMTQLAKRRWPGVPYFLLGHSMGSFVARQYTAQYGADLTGAIFMGTSGKNPLDWAGVALTAALGAVKGKRARSALVDKMAFGAYNKRIEHPVRQNDWLTRDAAVVQAYENDPYCSFSFTLGAYHELFKLLKGVSGKRWAERIPRALPLLVISGEADPVGQYGKGVRQVAGWLRDTGHENVTLTLYPGARHEVLNETDRASVYADVLSWLENNL